ncbi:MAG: polymerase sigma-54 factor [Chloroflexota bacterium]|nr:polymerase sigma-54 factor [Chloroflexota bacterium]
MYQRQFHKLQPQTTAHLAQTMTLLSMNVDELNQEINRAMAENPALVMKEERRCPGCGRLLTSNQICPVCSKPKDPNSDDAVVFLSPRNDFNYSKSSGDEDYFTDEIGNTDEVGLAEFILRQIAVDLEAQEDRIIAAYILNQVDDDGFLNERLIEIASYYHVPLASVEQVKSMIQHAEPYGVGSETPEEALLIQLEMVGESRKIPAYYAEVVKNGLNPLSKKQYTQIAKAVGISKAQAEEAAEFISKNLYPFPARAHWGSFRMPSEDKGEVYTSPDVIINHMNHDSNMPLMVEIITPSYGTLDINPLYKDAIKQSSDETKQDLKPDYDKANLLIKCIQQRNNTMQRLMEKIVNLQKGFIVEGEKFLTPVTRAEISKELEVHESTISRAVSNKSVQLPNGQIIPMGTFFDKSLGVRAVMREMIEAENPDKPLSDSDLVKLLGKEGHELARRTVAKYRSMEGILPAHMRKKEKKD